MLDPIYHALSTKSLGRLISAAATWPKFSVSSFAMTSRLRTECGTVANVIDVGANTGQFCIAASRTFPAAKVFSYEPNPRCFAELKRVTATTASVTCEQYAVGDSNGEISLRLNAHSHSSSILALSAAHKSAFPFAKEVGEVSVTIRTLDSLFGEGVDHSTLLKIDVQGYEMNVLRGAERLLTEIDYVVLEASFSPLYEGESTFDEICDHMRVAGLKVKAPVGWLTDPQTGKFIQMDLLFCRI